MRLERHLKEEDIVKKALELDEPQKGGDYDDEYVNKRIDIITSALESMEGKDDEASEAITADLKDKLEKWENVGKEPEEKPVEKEPEEKKEKEPEEKKEKEPEEKKEKKEEK